MTKLLPHVKMNIVYLLFILVQSPFSKILTLLSNSHLLIVYCLSSFFSHLNMALNGIKMKL